MIAIIGISWTGSCIPDVIAKLQAGIKNHSDISVVFYIVMLKHFPLKIGCVFSGVIKNARITVEQSKFC